MVSTSDCVVKTKPLTRKKVSKPLMEKKRRARINKCLDQLKSLLENYYTNNIRKRKLEKADILELTVKHLRNLQKMQSGSSVNFEFADYQAGYRSCLAGVNQYLAENSSNNGSRSRMLAHLSSSLPCAGGQAQNFITAKSNTEVKPVQPEMAVCGRMQRLLPHTVGHETSKAAPTVPFAGCPRALKPNTSSVSDSILIKFSTETSLVTASSACTNSINLSSSHGPCYRNKCLSHVQCGHKVTIHNVWRPW
ncbi:hairy-related 3 isoform X1 [Esox lucius]|uniref:Hairy-related 3 n=1 Tax=Esox lucius TaxID=8010 RepID=A0A3P8ZKD7_ESOLU|nr:hairy-related 3 isoform X1 [Esox lucius]